MNRLAAFTVIMFTFSACYTSPTYEYQADYVNADTFLDADSDRNVEKRFQTTRIPTQDRVKPWEVFAPYYDLQGRRINNQNIVSGDTLFSGGQKQQALGEYLKAQSASTLLPAEKESLILRLSTAELSQDHAKQAITILSNYFTQMGGRIEDVKAPFAVVYGYAYGRTGNIDQALAWFSQANRIANGNMRIISAAQTGTELILRSVPDEKLYMMPAQWNTDSFISAAIGKENKRRANTLTPQDNDTPIYSEELAEQTQSVGDQENSNIEVLLPLSGQYAALGGAVRNGITLVLDGREDGIKAIYQDTRGDSNQATAYVQNLAERNVRPVIIGPLLAAPASSASLAAKQANIPIIALSKRSDFSTGGSVFRLGATTISQVSSLLEKTYATFGMSKYAVIYPANENGMEYLGAFERVAQQMRLDIVYKASYHTPDNSTFISIGQALENVDVEAIFFPADIETSVMFMQGLSEGLRERIKILGTPAWDDLAKLEHSKQLMNNAIFVTPFFAQSQNSVVENFIAMYRQRFGLEPDFMAAQGFDVATLTVAALQRQKENGISFIQALHEIGQYEGVTGNIRVLPNGEISRSLTVLQYQNGQLMQVINNSNRVSPIVR